MKKRMISPIFRHHLLYLKPKEEWTYRFDWLDHNYRHWAAIILSLASKVEETREIEARENRKRERWKCVRTVPIWFGCGIAHPKLPPSPSTISI